MKMCLAGMAVAAAVASGGTYAGVTLTSSAPSCPAGVSAAGCMYLADLATAGLPIPSNAINAAGIICINLRSITVEAQARGFLLGHPAFTLNQAEQYIEITQKDMCDSTG
jgi:hypothetical protein